MKEWTFGIVTAGSPFVSQMIDSIESQGIPSDSYEIIVVGGNPISRKNTRHIPFNESQKANWITKKKMIVCEEAKFENIVLTHDYLIFEPGWYDGWLKFGDNNWDVAMNRILNGDGLRFRDWICQNPLSMIPYNITGYKPAQYISGTYWVAKKTFMLQNPLDLSRGWNDWEDIEWSFRCRDKWTIKMNPFSVVRCNKVKETWGVQGDVGVESSIHYLPLEKIINTVCDIKVADENGHMVAVADRGVRDLHYGDFDTLRREVRRLHPKHIVSIGCPLSFAGFAATWAAQEYGGKVTIADYGEGSYGIRLSKCLTKQFNWEQHVTHFPIGDPKQLSELKDVDFAILGGTYSASRKIEEINNLKNAFTTNANVFVYHSSSDELIKHLPGYGHIGNFVTAMVTK